MPPSPLFLAEMERKRGSQPKTKIEFIDKDDNVTDITRYYLSGANLEQVKERAPDEIQAGQFDVILANHDDTFSEYKPGSLLHELDYHGARIRILQGFTLPDGTDEYIVQGMGFIDQLITASDVSQVTFRCRDRLWRIMDSKIHMRPATEVPEADTGNTGNGFVTAVDTKPFATSDQNWTLTCTTGGPDNTAIFSVVGSIAGNIGNATSGQTFENATHGLRFTIRAGSINWFVGDKFTFRLRQHPQWQNVNAGKIIWSILTGHRWDTGSPENWADLVFDFDPTQTSANVDVDYYSFVKAIDDIDTIGVFDLTGYANYNTDTVQFLQDLLLLFLGSLYTGADGRIKMQVYVPIFGAITKTFTDNDKIMAMAYNRSIDEVVNSVNVEYVATPLWPFSSEAPVTDGIHVRKDDDSIDAFGEIGVGFKSFWYTESQLHVQDFADKLVSRYRKPPLNINFDTGMDALLMEIGEYIGITDVKYGLQAVVGEISLVRKMFDSRPAKISLMLRRDSAVEQQFGWIGSEVDEGDGESPQDDDYDTASVEDRRFAYFGNLTDPEPDYRIF